MNRTDENLFCHEFAGAARVAVLSLVIGALAGCATEDSRNEGARKGAIAGAALGLTMGALTGDAELAAKGAIAGGVAGGASGMMADYSNDREDYRAETIAGGLAGRSAPAATSAPAAPTTWDDIDKFPGQWRADIWSYEPDGKRVTAQATATGFLTTTRSATMKLDSITSNGEPVAITGDTVFGFDPEQQSYTMVNRYSTTPGPQPFVGEYLAAEQRYRYYYTGNDMDTRTGVARGEYRLEMRFIGRDVIIVETQVEEGGRFVPIQSYRFTRIK